jgi:hypothetical protein
MEINGASFWKVLNLFSATSNLGICLPCKKKKPFFKNPKYALIPAGAGIDREACTCALWAKMLNPSLVGVFSCKQKKEAKRLILGVEEIVCRWMVGRPFSLVKRE